MTKRVTARKKSIEFFSNIDYKMAYYKNYDYAIFDHVYYLIRPGIHGISVNDCICMLDTETSKTIPGKVCENYIVAWSLSVRVYHKNICTLYGNRPSECIECLCSIMDHLPGSLFYVYVYNLSYDYMFLRKFLFKNFGYPVKQLNTKSHYPIYIEFECGLVLRDGLILGQRKLEKWASDMGAEHQKAVGFWDYDIIRDQEHYFTDDELKYIENDTLAGVECIDILLTSLNKKIYSIPWTATGIPRNEVKERGAKNRGHELFTKQLLSFQEQIFIEKVFHGGYTHGNRLYYNETVEGDIKCFDFASSYPFVMLSEKFPSEKFTKTTDCTVDEILKNAKYNAYFFTFIASNVRLKNPCYPMPALQFSKCEKVINGKIDNGRILYADFIIINLTEIDLEVINDQYDFDISICVNVYTSIKDYLPRWFTDYVFELYRDKCELKNIDTVRYQVAKGKLNSLYGMTVQRPVKSDIIEDYETGDFSVVINDPEELYKNFGEKRSNVLNYQIGVWVTAYAFRNLFSLGSCAIGENSAWLYSDTDSCFGLNWNEAGIKQYNDECKKKLRKNKYDCVNINGREYWLGVAELDKEISQMRVVGAKRYCYRDRNDKQLHITVAGVPKNGVEVLNDDINNFIPGLIFPGTITGKKTHTYFYKDDIEVKNGIEYGDSVDLSPCDYLLSDVYTYDQLITEEIEVTFYE